MSRVTTVTTITATGQGRPTAGELHRALAEFPADATVKLSTSSDQREGTWWTLTAESRN